MPPFQPGLVAPTSNPGGLEPCQVGGTPLGGPPDVTPGPFPLDCANATLAASDRMATDATVTSDLFITLIPPLLAGACSNAITLIC